MDYGAAEGAVGLGEELDGGLVLSEVYSRIARS